MRGYASIILTFVLISLASSCGMPTINDRHGSMAMDANANTLKILRDPKFRDLLDKKLSESSDISLTDEKSIWALSYSTNYFPKKSGSLLIDWAKARGSLPQILVPQVREEIAKDSTIQTILSLPSFLKSIVNFFVNDEDIIAEIQAQITKLIDKIVQATTKLNTKVNFRFDHFIAVPNTYGDDINNSEFNLNDQILRWSMVFAADNYWDDLKPMTFDTHGLQVFETLRSLSELQYALGLYDDSKNNKRGLTQDISTGSTGELGPFDLRKDPQGKRYLSGRFRITYKNASVVKTATELKEHWEAIPTKVSLDEQAKLWMMGAKLFERLRPANRHLVPEIYKVALPNEVHGLPLTILMTMKPLLDGPFIDHSKYKLFKYAQVPGTYASEEGAGFMEAIRLAHALMLWTSQLENHSDLLKDASLSIEAQKIKHAPAQLREALQFVMQYLIGNFLNTNSLQQTIDSLDIENQAEAAFVLAKIEKLLDSPLLESVIEILRNDLVSNKVAKILKNENIGQSELLWIVFYLKSIEDELSNDGDYLNFINFIEDRLAL